MGTTWIHHGNGLIIEVEAAEDVCERLYDNIASNESEKVAEPTENKSQVKRWVLQAVERVVWSNYLGFLAVVSIRGPPG